jgi:hypothetical protein
MLLQPYSTHTNNFLPCRACIGRRYYVGIITETELDHLHFNARFSETEGVAAITTLLSRYKVSLKDEDVYRALPGETLEQRRVRIIKSDFQAILT